MLRLFPRPTVVFPEIQNESCAKCSKTVYPVERLSFLDKIWHKSCFSCTECEIVLTTKNAKGFEKNPYCSTHYPKLKPTVTPDDPKVAAARKAQNTISNVNYKSISKTPGPAGHNPTSHGDFSSKQDSKDQSSLSNVGRGESRERSGSIPADKDTGSRDNTSQFKPPKRSTSLNQEESDDTKANPKYVCISSYESTKDDELTVTENDIIFVERVFDDGWASAQIMKTGKIGLIPFNVLEKA
uniref:LIM and SH3 domain protein 1 (Trinotate prediction) n=1 Tax=Myxobolus squamalis TaxID=59785 RepID=A0A6B2FYH3_MYXSQ